MRAECKTTIDCSREGFGWIHGTGRGMVGHGIAWPVFGEHMVRYDIHGCLVYQ
jgi:hypothetical protein